MNNTTKNNNFLQYLFDDDNNNDETNLQFLSMIAIQFIEEERKKRINCRGKHADQEPHAPSSTMLFVCNKI
jgi:hypothetical protein